MRFRRSEPDDPPGLHWETDGPWKTNDELATRQTIQFEEMTYVCRTRKSPGGRWRIAYGTPIGGGGSRIFLFADDELAWHRQVDHPTHGLVANDGTVLIVSEGNANDLIVTIRVFDADGIERFEEAFDANIADVDMSPDGAFAVVQTQPVDNRSYLYDLQSAERLGTHESDWAVPLVARFGSTDGRPIVFLSPDHTKRPAYAVDVTGTMVWESRRHRKMRPLMERIKGRLLS